MKAAKDADPERAAVTAGHHGASASAALAVTASAVASETAACQRAIGESGAGRKERMSLRLCALAACPLPSPEASQSLEQVFLHPPLGVAALLSQRLAQVELTAPVELMAPEEAQAQAQAEVMVREAAQELAQEEVQALEEVLVAVLVPAKAVERELAQEEQARVVLLAGVVAAWGVVWEVVVLAAL